MPGEKPACRHCAPTHLGWQAGQAQQGQISHPAGSWPKVSRKAATGFPLASQRTRVLGHWDVFWHLMTTEGHLFDTQQSALDVIDFVIHYKSVDSRQNGKTYRCVNSPSLGLLPLASTNPLLGAIPTPPLRYLDLFDDLLQEVELFIACL